MRQSKTLVFDARMINSSGIGTDIQNLLPYLKNYFTVTLLGNPEELNRFTWAAGMRIIKFTSPIYSFAEQLILPLTVPTCDFFFSPHFNVPVLPLKAAKRIVLIHDIFHLAAQDVNPVHRFYARFLLQSSVSLSDKIITISEFSRSEMKRLLKVGNKQIHKIDLGVDSRVFHQQHGSGLLREVSLKYQLPAKYILFVGNVKPHKNLKNLVLAFHRLGLKTHPDLKLVIVGKKEGFITGDKSLFNLIEALALRDKVLFTGYVANEHLPVIYSLATLFVFPSLYEGFGLPPLEAMASGCPTIVSNAASIPEVCKDASLYFNGSDPDDIARALKTVLEDDELRMSLIFRGQVLVKKYTWENAAMALQNIILHQ